jgi:hypothetical protein
LNFVRQTLVPQIAVNTLRSEQHCKMEAGEIKIPLPFRTAPCKRMENLDYLVSRFLHVRSLALTHGFPWRAYRKPLHKLRMLPGSACSGYACPHAPNMPAHRCGTGEHIAHRNRHDAVNLGQAH